MNIKPILKKLPAASVLFGEEVSRNGKFVWGAFDGSQLIAIGETVGEARDRYRKVWVASLQRSGIGGG